MGRTDTDVWMRVLLNNFARFDLAGDLLFEISIDVREETWSFHIDR